MPFSNLISRNRLIDLSIGLASILTILVLWEFSVSQGWLNDYYFPPPSEIYDSAVALATRGFPRDVTIFSHMQATISRILKGYTLAALVGIPLGIFIGTRSFVDRAISPVVTFARSVATISLLPLSVAWFGVGEFSRVFLIFYGCFWIILTNAIYAVKTIHPQYIQAAQTLGATPRQIFFQVMLPASLPRIFAGMKIALGLAFLVIVAVEMIGTVEGLGALIMEARTFYRTDTMMVGMVAMSVFGFTLAWALDRLERLLLPWAESLVEVER